MGANIALLRYLYDVSVPLYSRRGTVPEQVLIDHSSLWFNSESERTFLMRSFLFYLMAISIDLEIFWLS